MKYWRNCDACQRFGPLKPTAGLKPILNLQPMDMLGMDFLGPITPAGTGGSRYVLIIVDYYSRFLFAAATISADGVTVVRSLQNIAKFFGWLLAIYCDNASYFVKGRVPEELKVQRVMQFSAPITHPSSVGLSERYVQLVLTGLWTVLAHDRLPLENWDACLDTVVFAINTRIVKVHGFAPSQLFMEMSPRVQMEDRSVRDEAMTAVMTSQEFTSTKFNQEVEDWHLWVTMAQREEQRDQARGQILEEQDWQIKARE